MKIHPLTIICGHYGTGKTNLSLNLARYGKDRRTCHPGGPGYSKSIFRSSDYSRLLEEHNIKLIAPRLGRAPHWTPALSAEIYSVFEREGNVIFDGAEMVWARQSWADFHLNSLRTDRNAIRYKSLQTSGLPG